ncbi:hypothetical protein CYMTET_35570 [Cymbomonas tetramitiformis]|uniref:RING-type domain-containing protein n=1 Tax=Cymbomonas tetramitiformis TaxID=36881 RepID=A0AAE0F8X8_9CHLO|nr:hypothetical protein CYMTET_35570 [Cymbomonas tetramitiformis]|eukprot:gene5192-6317_t
MVLHGTSMRDCSSEEESEEEKDGRHECAVCYDLFNDPINTPCAHIFCRECLRKAISSAPLLADPVCPLCRGPLGDFDAELAKSNKPLIKEMGSFPPNRVTFEVGNRFGYLPEKMRLKDNRWWVLYVKTAEGELPPQKYISKVVFELDDRVHEGLSNTVSVVTRAPYELTRVGFNLRSDIARVAVHFKAQWGHPPLNLEVVVHLEDEGQSTPVVAELSQPDMQRISALAKPRKQTGGNTAKPLPPWLGGPIQHTRRVSDSMKPGALSDSNSRARAKSISRQGRREDDSRQLREEPALSTLPRVSAHTPRSTLPRVSAQTSRKSYR